MNVDLYKADATNEQPEIDLDLKRFDRANLPVNIIVPANPDQKLLMTKEFFGADYALKILEAAANGVPEEVASK